MDPLKSRADTIKGKEQLKRWEEHCYELYFKEHISNSTLNTVEHLPVMKELELLLTAEELSRAIGD